MERAATSQSIRMLKNAYKGQVVLAASNGLPSRWLFWAWYAAHSSFTVSATSLTCHHSSARQFRVVHTRAVNMMLPVTAPRPTTLSQIQTLSTLSQIGRARSTYTAQKSSKWASSVPCSLSARSQARSFYHAPLISTDVNHCFWLVWACTSAWSSLSFS